jgi:catalase
MLLLPGARRAEVDAICRTLCGEGAKVEHVSRMLGALQTDEDRPIDVTKTFLTTDSVLYDAVVIPGGANAAELAKDDDALHFVRDSYRHAKAIAASNEGIALLEAARLPGVGLASGKRSEKPSTSLGVVTVRGDDLEPFARAFVEAIRAHRHFEREHVDSPSRAPMAVKNQKKSRARQT